MKRTLILLVIIILLLTFSACGKQTDPANTNIADDASAIEPGESVDETAGVQQSEEPTQEPIPKGVEHTNILLMGSKERDFSTEEESYYSLTHILITLDPNERAMKFTTFPYNLAVDIEDEGTAEQLQFVSSKYGEEKTVEILENNFGIDIDYYVIMNMEGVIDIVDALEGVQVDVKKLTVNETGEIMAQMLGLVWQEVKTTGRQVLSGVQTAGFFNDTTDVSADNWLEEEELIFRERHPEIINAVIAQVKLAGFDEEDMITIAHNVSANYAANIPEDKWKSIAATAIYCMEGETQFLHVPQSIDTMEHDGTPPLIYDKDVDVSAVRQFAGK